ncbi:unnamed protein product [Diabrotica balteata]|uniref:Uncharacterized protein n=1 Tax=Diabrotica balteata TaxID=107213 RepID=A0A9N9TBQ9_DIABA|nr:unnamed protein product [Diabrotica balteata]
MHLHGLNLFLVVTILIGLISKTVEISINKRYLNSVEDFKDIVEEKESDRDHANAKDISAPLTKRFKELENHNVWPLPRVKTDVKSVDRQPALVRNVNKKLKSKQGSSNMFVMKKMRYPERYYVVRKKGRHRNARNKNINIKSNKVNVLSNDECNKIDYNCQLRARSGNNDDKSEQIESITVNHDQLGIEDLKVSDNLNEKPSCEELNKIFHEVPFIHDMVQALLERNSPRNVNDAWKTIKCAIRQDPTILNNGQLDNGKQCFQKFVRNNRKRRHSTYINFKNHKKKINTNLAKRSSQNDPRFDAIVDFIIKNKMFSDNFTYVPIVFAKVTNNGGNVTNGSSETFTQKMLQEKNLTTANGMNGSFSTIKDVESSTISLRDNGIKVNNTTSNYADYSTVTKVSRNISNIFRREDNTLQPSSGMNDTELVIPEPEQNPLELGIPEEDAVVEQYDETSTDLSQNGTYTKGVTLKINNTTPNSITSSQNSNRKKKNISEIVLEPIQTDKALRSKNYEVEYSTDAGEVPITFALNDTNILYNATATCQFTTLRNFIANETCQTEQAVAETTENNFIKPAQNTTNLSILQSNNNKALQSKNNGTNVYKTVTDIDLYSDSYSTTVLNNESSIIESLEQNCTNNYSIDLMNSTTINATVFENKNQTVGPVNLLKETLIKGGITNDNFSSLKKSLAENTTQYSFINESTRSIGSSIKVELAVAVNVSDNLCITSNGSITTVGAISESFINNNSIALSGSSPNGTKMININPVTEASNNGTNNFTQNIEFTSIQNATSNNFTNESNSTTNYSTNACITVNGKYDTSLDVETRSDNKNLVEGTTTSLNLTVSNQTDNTTGNSTVMFDSMESTTINTTTLKNGNSGAIYSSSNGDFSNNGTKSDYVIFTTESITNKNLTVNYSALPSKLYKEQDMVPGVLIYRKEQEENKNIAKTKRDVYDIVEPELFDFNIQSNIGITIEEPSDVNNNKYVDFNPLIKQKKSIVPFNCSDETMKMLDTLHQLNLSNFEEETTETIHLTTITETSPLPNYDQVQKLTDVDAGIGKDVDSSLLQDSNQTFSEYQIPRVKLFKVG